MLGSNWLPKVLKHQFILARFKTTGHLAKAPESAGCERVVALRSPTDLLSAASLQLYLCYDTMQAKSGIVKEQFSLQPGKLDFLELKLRTSIALELCRLKVEWNST